MSKNKNTFQTPTFRVNEQIHGHEVRIVGDGIESRVLPLNEAKKIAYTMGLDLIEINPNGSTPIVKVASYDKMLYELKKAAKKRELARRDENKKSIFEFITLLDEVAVPESMPKDEGNKTIVILKKRG